VNKGVESIENPALCIKNKINILFKKTIALVCTTKEIGFHNK